MALKRNKPLRQKTPLKSKTQLKSKTGLKPGSKKLAFRSKKMEDVYVDRREFVKKILSERPLCEACGVFAKHDNKATYNNYLSRDVHEIVRRSQGGSILDENNVLAVCRLCHIRIGNYPELAFDLGLAKHSWERGKGG